jgi:hypothetical protein
MLYKKVIMLKKLNTFIAPAITAASHEMRRMPE